MGDKSFEIELEDGTRKIATVLTELKTDNGLDYLYYSVNDDDGTDNVSIFVGRIDIIDGKECLCNLRDNEEREFAYDLFKPTYIQIVKNKEIEERNINKVFPYNGREPFIFVSYSHKDTRFALDFIAYLQAAGFRVWFDEGINPGTEWDEYIAKHIDDSDLFISIISSDYIISHNCKDEFHYASYIGKNRLLLFFIEDTELPSGMKLRATNVPCIKYGNYNSYSDIVGQMCRLGIWSCVDPINIYTIKKLTDALLEVRGTYI